MRNEDTARVVRGVLSLGRRLRAAHPDGSISLSATSILATLWRVGPMPAVQLATEERLQPQSLTRLIAGLERDGLISRTPNEHDRREVLLELTPRGLNVLAADMQTRRQWLEQAMSHSLSDDEREVLLQASQVMLKLASHDADMPTPSADGPAAARSGRTQSRVLE
jgi:DNA-binding MarR family transcriptional regulator